MESRTRSEMSVQCKCGKVASKRDVVGPCGQRAWRTSWTMRVFVCECGRYYPLIASEAMTKTQYDWIRVHNKKVDDHDRENCVPQG